MGSTCHIENLASASQSMKARPPWPSGASSADMGSRTPARRRSKTASRRRVTAAVPGAPAPSGVRATHDAAVLGRSGAGRDRHRQIRRRREIEPPIKRRELPPVETVELAHGIGGVVVAEPPEPVGALAKCELPFRARSLRRIALLLHHPVVGLLGVTQQIP